MLAELGGFEIAVLVGVALGCAANRVVCLLDGFITGAAALVAARLAPDAVDAMIASHRSPEPGHALVLDALGLEPLLDLGLRLGEGTGAALALPLLRAAVAISNEMATFADAGVTDAGRYAELRGLAAAVAFLTRVPVGRCIELDAADVARGVALPARRRGHRRGDRAASRRLADPLTAPLAARHRPRRPPLLTGALHLDALADTADALGATTRERALEIMRDHSIGPYGGVALVLDLGLKAAALAALAGGTGVVRFAVCAAAASRVCRCCSRPHCRTRGPARGLGRALADERDALRRAVVVAARRLRRAPGRRRDPARGGRRWRGRRWSLQARWLGGITGDILGAAAELAETAALVVAVALV